MPEVTFEFTDPSGLNVDFQYENDGGQSGKMKVTFKSPKSFFYVGDPMYDIKEMRPFSLQFNAIGKDDPLGFLESLDEGYLNDKVSGLYGRKDDLFKTIQNVRTTAEENKDDLTAAQLAEIERKIDASATSFDGNHKLSCEILIISLKYLEVPCFIDDVYHLIGGRKTDENVLFHSEIWPDFLNTVDDHLAVNPEIQEQIDAVREGRAPVLSDDELEM